MPYAEPVWGGGAYSWQAAVGPDDDQQDWYDAESRQEGEDAAGRSGRRRVRHRGRRTRKPRGAAAGVADNTAGAAAGVARRSSWGTRWGQPAADDRTGAPEDGAAASGSSSARAAAAGPYLSHYGHASELGWDQGKCDEVRAILDQDKTEGPAIYDWVEGSVLELSLKKGSCRLIQELIDAVDRRHRERLLEELLPGFVELYMSENGNHVLCKAFEVMPGARLTPFVHRVLEHDYLAVARHRFGCRVLERLIEHCNETEAEELLDRLVDKSGELCRNPFGNFVVKHMLEHCAARRRREVVENLLELLPPLAAHRNGSHVIQHALKHAGPEAQQWIITRLLQEAPPPTLPAQHGGKPALTLLEVAKSRYGSYVVEEILKLRSPETAELRDQVRELLLAHKEELLSSPFFERWATSTGLIPDGEFVLPKKASL